MKTKETKKVILIGGGIAGLAAGIYALRSGYEAEIYEKNPVPGGECIGWNRKGYHIDNCIHWLTGTLKGTEMYDVWEKMGALNDDTEYAKVDAFYTSTYGDKEVTLWNDLDKTRDELIAAAPEDEEEIRHLIQSVEYAKQCLFPAAKPMEMWGIRDYIAMGKTMPDFPKVMKEFGKLSLSDYALRFKSPLLRRMITDYLPGDYTAYSFLVSYATMAMGNGGIPMGASLQMTLRIEKKFKALGGSIYYNKSASRILLEKGAAVGVEMEDGTVARGDYFIPTVDTRLLFGKLLPESYMPKELRKAYDDSRKYPAISGFQLAFAVSAEYAPVCTTFFDIEPVKMGSFKYDRMNIKAYGYDPFFVHDGKQVIQTGFPQSDGEYEYWKSLSPEEYKKEKERLVLEIKDRVMKSLPELFANGSEPEFLDAWTPLTYERYCNAYHGSYMSFVTTPEGGSVRMKPRIKGIKNLYPAGQWTSSPGGLPVAASSGKFAIQRILRSEKRSIEI